MTSNCATPRLRHAHPGIACVDCAAVLAMSVVFVLASRDYIDRTAYKNLCWPCYCNYILWVL